MGSQLIRPNSSTGQTKMKKISPDAEKSCMAPGHLASCHLVSNAANSALRKRLTVLYSGRVQGVGFRYTAKTVATGFDITGTICNLADGRVELVAEGTRSELDAFRAALHDAGLAGFIRDEKVDWADAKNDFRGFEITR
jgi:acylphosphatase